MEKRILTSMNDLIMNFHEAAKPWLVIGSCLNVYWDEPQLHKLRSARYIGSGKLPMCSFGVMCPDDGLAIANKYEIMTNATKVRELFGKLDGGVCCGLARHRHKYFDTQGEREYFVLLWKSVLAKMIDLATVSPSTKRQPSCSPSTKGHPSGFQVGNRPLWDAKSEFDGRKTVNMIVDNGNLDHRAKRCVTFATASGSDQVIVTSDACRTTDDEGSNQCLVPDLRVVHEGLERYSDSDVRWPSIAKEEAMRSYMLQQQSQERWIKAGLRGRRFRQARATLDRQLEADMQDTFARNSGPSGTHGFTVSVKHDIRDLMRDVSEKGAGNDGVLHLLVNGNTVDAMENLKQFTDTIQPTPMFTVTVYANARVRMCHATME